MIVDVLLSLLFLAIFVQPNRSRAIAAALFIGITLFHRFFIAESDGLLYYGGAALADIAIIILTSYFARTPVMVITLHKICFAFIVVNFAGWALWISYFPPFLYDLACAILYILALLSLISGGGYAMGNDKYNGWYTNIFINNSSGANAVNKDGSET